MKCAGCSCGGGKGRSHVNKRLVIKFEDEKKLGADLKKLSFLFCYTFFDAKGLTLKLASLS